MKDTPIPFDIVKQKIEASKFSKVGRATIREIVQLVNEIEVATNIKFVRMEMGVPGLEPSKLGIEAEVEALRKGVARIYPMVDGLPELKKEMARFVKNFMNIDVAEKCCIPTVGSMQGGMAAFLLTNRCQKEKDTILFIDPGFPVQKQQVRVLGMKSESFDVYNYRGEKLKDKLESYLSKGNISTIIYSNPNNPSWICFTEKELQIIGQLATQYDVVVIEDLAYFAMDFRKDLSKPGEPPYQVSVANYTDNWLLLISSSKIFSYAGQRIGAMVISNRLFERKYPDLKRFFASDEFGRALIYGAVYALSSGTSHSAQYALAAMLKAANDGKFNFVEVLKEYGERARVMKKLFTENGFKIVYDMDEDKPLADGFYFTISYPELSGEDLIEELIYYGISAISLSITGSDRSEGLRACVSHVQREQFADLEYRLKKFKEHHPVK
ncbi:MAG TPA: pyridoxal phosphate-dependent aminotransferase [Tenuifilaceae bacterium]|jgi:aspartate/methionine/tyrosine aminotransferase|nr:pyridoxal phosphate-dependent aminotransferase [Bacteroidota bacterium]MZP81782.1 aminotransferase class I/II-fold pyridoxal phosphate-dependent enzyme [Bacteroidales bacterium]NLH57378.1 pyridoxal phosphate-dependent aminotransferase [Rikenellaceae bacterium]OQC64580.1 MAG: Glutamate-pyruvate aminotransferase AlaC [Bacteroidetes bacterium ADurb.Bin008]HNV81367.1 pyridoxal phosphate-dependent aminotransferase [Tenuifilaceae bacterium]